MAKATLPTNFKDDILASSMGSKRRYNVINNSDGTISLEDVTTYTQVGSTFGAAQINATNAAANAAADASKIIDDYDTLMANTQAGYMAGALAVKELNSNLGKDLKLLKTQDMLTSTSNTQTIDLTGISGNIIVVFCGYNSNGWGVTGNINCTNGSASELLSSKFYSNTLEVCICKITNVSGGTLSFTSLVHVGGVAIYQI